MMNWFFRFIWTSIGKKLLMAVTGISFCVFLLLHLAGNLTVFRGKEMLVAYSEKLHALGPLLTLAEFGLLFLAVVHVLTGAFLFYENLTARPQKYALKKGAGGRTIGSATMPYTGFLILIFVVIHLLNFHFVDKTEQNIFQIVAAKFSNPVYVVGYIAAMLVAAVHVSHGFWSAFQTIGASHPQYTPLIKGLGILFSLLFAIGFGVLPIYITIIS